jgi:hypothetical protein
MTRLKSLFATIVLAGITFFYGCASVQLKEDVDFELTEMKGQVVNVYHRVTLIGLPEAGGSIFIYSPGEREWNAGDIRGKVGRVYVGRAGNDFGVPYTIAYFPPGVLPDKSLKGAITVTVIKRAD